VTCRRCSWTGEGPAYTLAPSDRAPLGADRAVAGAARPHARGLTALVFTREEVWHTHPAHGRVRERHFAEWPKRAERIARATSGCSCASARYGEHGAEPCAPRRPSRHGRGRGHDPAPRAWCERCGVRRRATALLIVASAELPRRRWRPVAIRGAAHRARQVRPLLDVPRRRSHDPPSPASAPAAPAPSPQGPDRTTSEVGTRGSRAGACAARGSHGWRSAQRQTE